MLGNVVIILIISRDKFMSNHHRKIKLLTIGSLFLCCNVSFADICPGPGPQITVTSLPCTLPGKAQNGSGYIIYDEAWVQIRQENASYTLLNIDTQQRSTAPINVSYYENCAPNKNPIMVQKTLSALAPGKNENLTFKTNCTYAYAVQTYGQSTVNDRGIGTVFIANLASPPENAAVLQISEP
jgi:hypothetical protein